jgi:hypothetical protein
MTLEIDDLGKALQENLKLRRELAANVTKAEATSQRGGGIVYRLGWVLYWTCLAIIGLWVAWMAALVAGGSTPDAWDVVLVGALPLLLLYGLGRAFRYVLSGE